MANSGDGGGILQAPPQGLYQLTVVTDSDDCAPQRPTGDTGTVAIGNEPNVGINIPYLNPIAGLAAFSRQDLLATNGYAASNVEVAQCGSGSATVQRQFQLLQSDAQSAQVILIEDWSVARPCDGGPQKSCHSERTLRYSLVQTCGNPLILTNDFEGHMSCR